MADRNKKQAIKPLESCPSCKKRISPSARNCPNCGHVLDAGWGEAVAKKRQIKEGFAGAGCLVMIVGLGLLYWSGSSRKEDPCGDRIAAVTFAEILVKRRLKAPSTADFASITDTKTQMSSCGTWLVRSYVDSQNSFGATLRTHFIATVRRVGDNSWVLDRLVTEP